MFTKPVNIAWVRKNEPQTRDKMLMFNVKQHFGISPNTRLFMNPKHGHLLTNENVLFYLVLFCLVFQKRQTIPYIHHDSYTFASVCSSDSPFLRGLVHPAVPRHRFVRHGRRYSRLLWSGSRRSRLRNTICKHTGGRVEMWHGVTLDGC